MVLKDGQDYNDDEHNGTASSCEEQKDSLLVVKKSSGISGLVWVQTLLIQHISTNLTLMIIKYVNFLAIREKTKKQTNFYHIPLFKEISKYNMDNCLSYKTNVCCCKVA